LTVVSDFLDADMKHLINTFRWKKNEIKWRMKLNEKWKVKNEKWNRMKNEKWRMKNETAF
jgi:hypothetical protein